MTITGLDDARRVLGDSVLGPEEIRRGFDIDPFAILTEEERGAVGRVPFDAAALTRARDADALLVLRLPRDATVPLTMLRLADIVADGLDPRAHTGVGYELRDEWTIDDHPFATAETCAAEWALVRRAPLPTTFNRTYAAQDAVLASLHAPRASRPARRSAVEITYDTLLWYRARGERLLAAAWDWSRSETIDAGYVALGEFGETGIRAIGYSGAVRFGSLGVCIQE